MPNRNRKYAPTCSFDGCDRPHNANGYCQSHDVQLKRGKPLTPIKPHRPHVKPLRHDPQDMFCTVQKGHQQCVDCKQIKPLDEFALQKIERGKLKKAHCRACDADRRLDYVFGEGACTWFYKTFEQQGRRCAMCGTDNPAGKPGYPSVRKIGDGWCFDHDHTLDPKDPASWRMVLCHMCNIMLGNLETSGWDAKAFMASANILAKAGTIHLDRKEK